MGKVIDILQNIHSLNATQQDVLSDPKRAILVQGGLGSGKSLTWQMDALITAFDNPGADILVLRKTFDQVIDSVVADLDNNFSYENLFPAELLYGGSWDTAFIKNDRRPHLKLNTGGTRPSRLHFRGAMHDGREDPKRFGSMPYVAAYFEEFSDFDNPKVFNYIDGRCRQKVSDRSYNRLMLVGNPPPDSHWSQYEFRTLPAERPEVAALRSFYIMPTEENRLHLPEGYIENMLATYSRGWVDRYLKGEAGIIEEGQPVMEGFFMPESRDGRPWHVAGDRIDFNPDWPVIRGWDFGVAYMACVWAQFIPIPKPHINILHSITGRNTNAYAFGHLVNPVSATMFPGAKFIDVGDPTGVARANTDGQSAYSVLADKHKIHIVPAPTNSVTGRINSLVEAFSKNSTPGTPYIQLSNSVGTAMLRDGLESGWGYTRQKDGYIKSNAEPSKNQYSHSCDGLGYIVVYLASYSDGIERVDRNNYGMVGGNKSNIINIASATGWKSA